MCTSFLWIMSACAGSFLVYANVRPDRIHAAKCRIHGEIRKNRPGLCRILNAAPSTTWTTFRVCCLFAAGWGQNCETFRISSRKNRERGIFRAQKAARAFCMRVRRKVHAGPGLAGRGRHRAEGGCDAGGRRPVCTEPSTAEMRTTKKVRNPNSVPFFAVSEPAAQGSAATICA